MIYWYIVLKVRVQLKKRCLLVDYDIGIKKEVGHT